MMQRQAAAVRAQTRTHTYTGPSFKSCKCHGNGSLVRCRYGGENKEGSTTTSKPSVTSATKPDATTDIETQILNMPMSEAVLPLASVFMYGGLTVGSVLLASPFGVPEIASELFKFDQPTLLDGLYWSIPLFALLGIENLLSGKWDFFDDMEKLTRTYAIFLKKQSLLSLFVLAVGAGWGEEALFRGLLQPLATEQLHFAGEAAEAASITLTSVLFGAAHAVNPAYFVVAMLASLSLGAECVNAGLGAAAFTHFFYDFVALLGIVYFYKLEPEGDAKKV